MNMTRKRSPRKKRNENRIHFDIIKSWMFSCAIFGFSLITPSEATLIALQNTTQNPIQEQGNLTNNTSTVFFDSVSNATLKIQPDKLLNTTISLNKSENVNNILNRYHSMADNMTGAIRAGNSSNLVEIHIRVIDKNDPINGAPLSDVEKYKYDIDAEFSTQYETVYNNNFENDLDISTEFEIITDNSIFDNDPETTTDAIFITTEIVPERNYKRAIENVSQLQDELLERDLKEKKSQEILQSTTSASQFAVTSSPSRVQNNILIHNVQSLKKQENVTRHNIHKNKDCLKFENCSNAMNTKFGRFLNITSNNTAKSDSNLQEIVTVKNKLKYVDSNSEENLVGDVEIMSNKPFKLNEEVNENSTKPYLKKEKFQYTTKKYYSLNENSNTDKITGDTNENKMLIPAGSSSVEIVQNAPKTDNTPNLKTLGNIQSLTAGTRDNTLNVSMEKFNNSSITLFPKHEELEKVKNIENNNDDSSIHAHKNVTKIKVNSKDGITSVKMEHKNISNESDELKNSSKVKDIIKNGEGARNRKRGEKDVSREVTTEEDYNSSYEAEEDDDEFVSKTGKKSMTEPLHMGPFGAIRDFAGSLVESLVERIIPKGIRDIMKRMQHQNEQLETIKLRSREENGGLGQFGRSLLKGLTQPLNQWMQGVRDYGSLDSDRNFFSNVASGVASVADSVGDAFKDRVKAIFPGTLWCGDGDMAKSAEVGLFFMTDTCCRRHDTCRLYISAGDTKYGLTNTGIFTRSHCECDKAFYRCLKRTNSLISSQIGVTYFSILGPQCFKREHPIMRCKRRTRLTGQKCEEYDLDYSQPKMWQWFDTETF